MNKTQVLIKRWRQAANEATTADSAATYTECADALERATAVKHLVAICEGCGRKQLMPTNNPAKVYPDPPPGWSQSGIAKRGSLRGHAKRLATWCPDCRNKVRHSRLATAEEPSSQKEK